MTITYPPTEAAPTPRRIAVFGSVAAERRPREHEHEPSPLSPSARAALESVPEAIARSAPTIARPIVDRAVADGVISRAERHELMREVGDPDSAAAPRRPSTARVLSEALAAVRRASPSIAEPILHEAVADERLTEAQERRILERLAASPAALRASA